MSNEKSFGDSSWGAELTLRTLGHFQTINCDIGLLSRHSLHVRSRTVALSTRSLFVNRSLSTVVKQSINLILKLTKSVTVRIDGTLSLPFCIRGFSRCQLQGIQDSEPRGYLGSQAEW